MTDVADKLREARALIEKHGWTQNFYRDEEGCLCTYGAIQLATTGDAEEENDPCTKPVEEVLKRAIETPWIATWNDDPKRTQAEVLAAFDKAIELAESGQ